MASSARGEQNGSDGGLRIGDPARRGRRVSLTFDGETLDAYEGETIGVELPISVELKVVETEPGFAGDTQSGAKKPATLESGLVVQVPIFIDEGDTIKVDTRTGEYQTRV